MTCLRAQTVTRGDPWVLLEGQAAVEAALAGWWEVTGVMLHDAHPWEVPAWSGLEVVRKPLSEFEGLADVSRHGGVLGLARLPAETTEIAAFTKSLESAALLVVCPRLNDAAFAGAVTRHAEVIGAAGVLFGAEGESPFGPDAIKASGGAVFRVPVRVADGGQLLRCLKAAKVDLTGLETGLEPVTGYPSDGRRAVVVGDPQSGLGPFWRAACDRRGGGDLGALLRGLAVAVK
jgi:tRNA G18 (ribose-2'-O)-methylase SpoU